MKRVFIALMLACGLTAVAQHKMPRRIVTPPTEFNLATYNIRLPAGSDSVQGNGWGRRLPYIAGLVKFHEFDIFGTQEGVLHQLDSLRSRLPGYDYIGVGRDNGAEKGEHAAIFYDSRIFDLKDHGDFWLSETPEKPSKGWDAAYPRVCTWGRFVHKPTGREFVMFNLHMDHIGRKARAESVKLITKKIAEFGVGDLPVFLTGDFNIDQNNPLINEITATGMFKDSHEAAPIVYEPNGTFNAFNPQGYTASRLDHIFVSPKVDVKKFGVLTDSYRTLANEMQPADFSDSFTVNVASYVSRLPSDHYPVMVRVRFE
jgi:endonuclease/exonuclease/phosphatase family protein